jgi:hypothetical protein
LANLLPRTESPEPFPPLDPEQHARFESRLRSVVLAASSPDGLRRLARRLGAFDGPLDELESDPSLIAAFDLLDGLERARVEVSVATDDRVTDGEVSTTSPRLPPLGELICYWPGRSLSTGEAAVASRGFFDMLDRPPIEFWIEAVARPIDSTREKFEIAIIAWIPKEDLERAATGRRACTSGSLAMLSEASQALARQLSPILVGRSQK